MGEWLILSAYWAILLLMLWTNAIFKSPSALYGIEWEVVGFRAAWVSTTQLPLVYCTGCRINPISLITGISHERLNWFHRWAARTLFLTLIVHWAFFYHEWDLSNFVQQEIKLMPMVIWGFVAWGMIGLMVITGYDFLRERFYEFWILQHIASAYLLLAFTYRHTHGTTYYVIACLGLIAFDISSRAVLWIMRNMHFVDPRKGDGVFGSLAKVHVLDEVHVAVEVQTVSFRWRAGQHIYLTIPHLRKFQSHPFTIANAANRSESSGQMSLVVKSHRGFTRDLFQWGLTHPSGTLTAFLNGPYGNPPSLAGNDTVILISTGSRASFIVSLLQDLVLSGGDIPKVHVHLICRTARVLGWYQTQLLAPLKLAQQRKIDLQIQIHVTREVGRHWSKFDDDTLSILSPDSAAEGISTTFFDGDAAIMNERDSNSTQSAAPSQTLCSAHELRSSLAEAAVFEGREKLPVSASPVEDLEYSDISNQDQEKLLTVQPAESPSDLLENFTDLHTLELCRGRPSLDTMIRPAVIDAQGPVLVVAAASRSLVGNLTFYVSRLTREMRIPAREEQHGPGGGVKSLRLWCEQNGE